jgi:hypothetical protein
MVEYELSKIVKVDATKEKIISVLKKLTWELGYNNKYFFTLEPVYDDKDYTIGYVAIAVYPGNNFFEIKIDKRDYPKGHVWEAKLDLDNNIAFLKEKITEK